MKDSEVKKIIAEAVIGFLNEARFAGEPDDAEKKIIKGVPFKQPTKSDTGEEDIIKTHHTDPHNVGLSPWINKKSTKPYIHPSLGNFKPNPPGLNERQMAEIEAIYEELEKGLRD
jgi:hypothetical protein